MITKLKCNYGDLTPPSTDMEKNGTSEYPPMAYLEFIADGNVMKCRVHEGSEERYPNEE